MRVCQFHVVIPSPNRGHPATGTVASS
jgi:hypothetical protein